MVPVPAATGDATHDVRITIAITSSDTRTRSLELQQVAGESDDDFIQRVALVLEVLKRRTM